MIIPLGWLQKRSVWFASLWLFNLFFVLARIPYYSLIHTEYIDFDTPSYLLVAQQIIQGETLPLFHIRTPGYPLFVVLCHFFSDNLMGVVYVQTLLTWLAFNYLLFTIHQYFKIYTLPTALALIATTTSIPFLYHEVTIQTENLFIFFLVLFLCFVIRGLFSTHSMRYWALASAMLGIELLIRPAALYLTGVLVLLMIYFWQTKAKKSQYISLISPMLAIGILLCTYNSFSIKRFTLSPFGNYNLPGMVMSFAQPKPEYPAHLNRAITESANKMPQQFRNHVLETWDMDVLQNSIIATYDYIHFTLYPSLREQNNYSAKNEIDLFYAMSKDGNQIYKDNLKEHPVVFVRFFVSMFIDYLENISTSRRITYPAMASPNNWISLWLGKQYYEKPNLYGKVYGFQVTHITQAQAIRMAEKSQSSFWWGFFIKLDAFQQVVFQQLFWIGLTLISLILALYKLFKERWKSTSALIVLIIGGIHFMADTLNSLVMISTTRYASTTFLSVYLSVALIGLVLPNKIGKIVFVTDPQ